MNSRRAVAAVLVALCVACAGFRGEELPWLELPELAESERLPAVTYELSNTITSPRSAFAEQSVDRIFRKVFSDVEQKESAEGLHLDVHFTRQTRQPMFTMGISMLSVLTLGVIPGYERAEFGLLVRVEVDGKLAKRYEYEDHVTSWMQLVMIPWAFSHDPEKVEQSVHENMLLNFLHDFRKDLPGLLPGPASG